MSDDPDDFDAVEAVTVWDRRLVGCEPVTRGLCPGEPDEVRMLREAWDAARRAGRKCFVVESRDGRRAVWQAAHEFWDV
jgi:hypothetical protein